MSVIEFPGGPSLPTHPVTGAEIDKLHSRAFRELECDICECVQMSRLAADLLCGVDDGSNAPELFAVVHLHNVGPTALLRWGRSLGEMSGALTASLSAVVATELTH